MPPEPPEGREWLTSAAYLLCEPDPGPTPWLVDRFIVNQALVAAVGRWKTTKSYSFLDVSVSIVTGRPLFGTLAIPQPGPVVFVNEESGRTALRRRLDALCRGRAIDPDELLELHVAANVRARLDDPGWQNELVDVGRELRPRLFVFDPLARMKSAERDENEQKAMAGLIEYLRALRDETGAAVAFVHHVGHAGGHMRGSSDLESAWETRLTWTRDGQSPLVKIESEHREAEAGDPITYRIAWDHDTRSMRFNVVETDSTTGPTLAERILAHVAEHPRQRADEIAKAVGVRRDHVDRALAEEVADGDLETGRSGRIDKLGREIRDTAYTLPGGASRTLFDDTPGTRHGTRHNGPSRPRTHQDAPPSETRMNTGTVARPDNGTHQDAPHAGHRGPVARPAPLGADPGTGHRTSHPSDATNGHPDTDLNELFGEPDPEPVYAEPEP